MRHSLVLNKTNKKIHGTTSQKTLIIFMKKDSSTFKNYLRYIFQKANTTYLTANAKGWQQQEVPQSSDAWNDTGCDLCYLDSFLCDHILMSV